MFSKSQESSRLVNLAKVSANGQITMPAEVRRMLRLEPGDKVLFIQRANGEVVVANAAQAALAVAQHAFAGAAADFGVQSPEDVQGLIDDLRAGSHASP
jgi:AbrB family looped-hinge helix DNA binding protein